MTVTGATTFGGGGVTIDNITINDNTISSSSNADINITPGGTGSIVISSLTIDSNISITDNEIKATASNSNLEIAGSGTGQVVIAKADINSGAVDNTVIGGATPLAGTFTTLTANTSAVIDGVTITDNVISSNSSNANLYLTGNHAYNGGGIGVFRLIGPTMENIIVQENSSYSFGGGIFQHAGVTTISNTKITDNTALTKHGGRIAVFFGGALVNNMEISNNIAEYLGGGAAFYQSEVDLINTTVVNNIDTVSYTHLTLPTNREV
mgnify:CR=1 FL=1